MYFIILSLKFNIYSWDIPASYTGNIQKKAKLCFWKSEESKECDIKGGNIPLFQTDVTFFKESSSILTLSKKILPMIPKVTFLFEYRRVAKNFLFIFV